ncbi:MAG: T9SS type A sorting domain-containing protein [Ferruginibacter sp.]
MKKIILTAIVFASVSIMTDAAFANSISIKANTDKVANNKEKEMSIVPDRASGEAMVRFKSAKAGTASITVLDETGKIVLQQTNQLTNGINNLPVVNSLKLNEGTYTIQLVTNNQTFSSRFILWK